MKTKTVCPERSGRQAFTLIELMVVVVIVSILIGGVFQLLRIVGKMNSEKTTIARIQRVQNAISGFYAEYGYYPPVSQYSTPDPWAPNVKDDFGEELSDLETESGFAQACKNAARSQIVGFEFPPAQGLDPFITKFFQDYKILSPNTLFGATADKDNVTFFKFGLLSFLLPRVELTGFSGWQNINTEFEPHLNFFKSPQWKKNNPVSGTADENNEIRFRKALDAQRSIENRAVARWLPNLERLVSNGTTLLGVDTRAPFDSTDGDAGSFKTSPKKDDKGKIIDILGYEYHNQKYVLQFVTVKDDWGEELYYYSPPPYQSFRLWSAGPDKKTFPPWIPINSLNSKQRNWVADWTKDDIVRFE